MAFDVPDACTLSTAERPRRLAEFDDLLATAVRRVESIGATHARLHLTGPAGLAARVRDLAVREAECCSFFTFGIAVRPATDGEAVAVRPAADGEAVARQLAADGEAVVLDLEVEPAHADLLAALAQRASAVATAATS